MESDTSNRQKASKKVQTVNLSNESKIYKTLKMAFYGMTMDDFKIFAFISAHQTASWDDIEKGTGCTNAAAANTLNKLCGSKSVSGTYRYYLVKEVKGLHGDIVFALTEKGQQFSQLFR
ncbi:hypothetical protein [Endozoicomonas ascidiicola]|uniref:hypothetical protein n=1 Tax=Endozoicomonas ascidiicola TaxID=1698521 RepID=UPI000835088A|nr:hypothetical protein [Endozoicomonas ascidiicola]